MGHWNRVTVTREQVHCKSARRLKLRSQRGFTLLELLVALTILAAMAAMLFGSFRMSVKAWSRGDKLVEGVQRFRIMAELMRRQLSCAYALDIRGLQEPETSTDPAFLADQQTLIRNGSLKTVGPTAIGGSPLFKGTALGLKFTGLYPMRPFANRGVALITYSTTSSPDGQGYRLIEEESRYLGPESVRGVGFSVPVDSSVVVFDHLEEVKFQYYGQDPTTGSGGWEDTWDSESRDSLPKAVAVELRLREDIGGMGLKHRFVMPVVAESFKIRDRQGVRGLFAQPR
jgi:prepilin-type N-terminal cleavage/methylation domain-containing protein